MHFDHAFSALPDRFHARVAPTPVARPELAWLHDGLARELGLEPDALRSSEGVAVLAGNRVPEGSVPLAMAYAGHQFGGFVPRLGDGRAILLGELRDSEGVAYDVQLKGAGRTPFSRGGDGRAWLGPALRELVVSEAMHALGVPTTRALAVVQTGESVYRERAWPGAVLTRVARSHVRVGTFEYHAHRGDTEALELLVEHVLQRHAPELGEADVPALALLDWTMRRQAALVAKWLGVGFIHGVMNTDNCSVVGDTLDYGPCAFLDTYHPHQVFSSIDHGGRYAYANQPRVAHWNLAVFAEALLPLVGDVDGVRAVLSAFPNAFAEAHLAEMRAKLGLREPSDDDGALAADLLAGMAEQRADFTRTFRALSGLAREPSAADDAVRSELAEPGALDAWLARWRRRLTQEAASDADRRAGMRGVNPAYIPRNHRIEEMIEAAVRGDLGPLDTLMEVLADPFTERPEHAAFLEAPRPHEVVCQTFCGT